MSCFAPVTAKKSIKENKSLHKLQIVEFVDEAVIERHVSDLADRHADGIDISRDETQKIDVPRRPCHGETHAYQ